MSVASGQWVAPDGAVFTERMIPVRIMCTRRQMVKIMEFTMVHYDQQAIMVFHLSHRGMILHRVTT